MNYIKFLCNAFNLKMFYSRSSSGENVIIFTFVNPLTNATTYYPVYVEELKQLDYSYRYMERDRKEGVHQLFLHKKILNCWWEREYLFAKLKNLV